MREGTGAARTFHARASGPQPSAWPCLPFAISFLAWVKLFGHDWSPHRHTTIESPASIASSICSCVSCFFAAKGMKMRTDSKPACLMAVIWAFSYCHLNHTPLLGRDTSRLTPFLSGAAQSSRLAVGALMPVGDADTGDGGGDLDEDGGGGDFDDGGGDLGGDRDGGLGTPEGGGEDWDAVQALHP